MSERLGKRDLPVNFAGKDVPGLRATIGYATPEAGTSLEALVNRAEHAMRAAKERNDGEAVAWTAALKAEPVDDPRRRCGACGATTGLQVKKSARRASALSKCANCDQPFDSAR